MKEKKYKYYEDIIEDYLALKDEQLQIPVLIEKSKDKLDVVISGKSDTVLRPGEANEAYKIYLQVRKYEERRAELVTEIMELYNALFHYLQFIDGCKVSYQRSGEKVPYLFWLEDGEIRSNQ